jgi:hypothetical protein
MSAPVPANNLQKLTNPHYNWQKDRDKLLHHAQFSLHNFSNEKM